jgi:hypothetical protein
MLMICYNFINENKCKIKKIKIAINIGISKKINNYFLNSHKRFINDINAKDML